MPELSRDQTERALEKYSFHLVTWRPSSEPFPTAMGREAKLEQVREMVQSREIETSGRENLISV